MFEQFTHKRVMLDNPSWCVSSRTRLGTQPQPFPPQDGRARFRLQVPALQGTVHPPVPRACALLTHGARRPPPQSLKPMQMLLPSLPPRPGTKSWKSWLWPVCLSAFVAGGAAVLLMRYSSDGLVQF